MIKNLTPNEVLIMSKFLDIVQSYCDHLEITIKNGHEWTTSMSVGRSFGKAHNQVLRDISRVWMPEAFREKNFVQRWKSYKNPCTHRNNYSPYYDCTIKGVLYLVLNWNGDFFQRMKISIVNDYFEKESEIERLSNLITGEPYKEVDKWQRLMAEKMFKQA